MSTFNGNDSATFCSVNVLPEALIVPTWPTTSSAPTRGAPKPAGVNDETVVPALKSSPIVAVSKLSRLTSIRSPEVLLEARLNVKGMVVDRFAVVVGAIGQIAPTTQVVVHETIALVVSFSIVSIGLANVRVTAV